MLKKRKIVGALAGSLLAASFVGCAPSLQTISSLHEPELWQAHAKVHHLADHSFSSYSKHKDAIRERAIELYDWPDDVDELVRNREIRNGMPSQAVYYSWGPPAEMEERKSSYSTSYTWQYGHVDWRFGSDVTWVYFDEEAILTHWSSYKDN